MSVTVTCTRCGQPMNATDRFCVQCGTGNPMSTRSPDSGASGSVWDVVQESLRAATRGEFDIAGELGHGGMAAVYLAHDIGLDKKVAIKVMAPSLMADASMIGRFQDEARTVAKLEHPNIVTVHAARQAGGLYFFVMKYIVGRDLDSILEQGPLPLAVVQALVYQVAAALQYAHGRNVIHRDIKPSNVMVDLEGNAVVMDFGIAKLRGARGHTMVGAAIGTPPYMSPEQCLGQEVSPASDQYSLGMVAYHLLTGRPPFTGEPIPVMRQQIEVDPPPIERLKDGPCPPATRDAIRRMLAKAPDKRWGSAIEAARAMGGHPLAPDDPLRDEIARLAQSGGFIPPTQIFTTPLSPSPSVGWAPGPVPPTAPLSPPPMPGASAPRSAPVTPPRAAPVTPPPTAPVAPPPSAAVSPPPTAPFAPPPTTPPFAPPPTTPVSPPPSRAAGIPPLAPPAVPATVLVPSDETPAVAGAPATVTPRPATAPLVAPVRPRRSRLPLIAAGVVGVAAVAVVIVLAVGTSGGDGDTGGGGTTGAGGGTAAPLEVTPQVLSVRAGEAAALTVSGAAPGEQVAWRSTDDAIVSVDAAGQLRAVREGQAYVIASAAGRVDSAAVTVMAGSTTPPASSKVARLRISPAQPQVRVGETVTLSAEAFDQGNRPVPQPRVQWRSAEPSRAAVSQDGVVTGRAAGSATVIAVSEGVEARATIAVLAAPGGGGQPGGGGNPLATRRVTVVFVTPPRVELDVGQSQTITAEPRDAQDRPFERPVTFRSDNEQVARVSSRGDVQAVAPGSAVIVAASDGIEGRAMIVVREPPRAPGRDTVVERPRAVTFAGVVAGATHTCAVASSGQALWCWGANDKGQVQPGQGAALETPTALTVSAGQVVAGGAHTCVLEGGAATCWGRNADGQLGSDNRNTTRNTISGVQFRELSAGVDHTCGVTTAGQVLCWGKNNQGQLGDGTTSGHARPTPIKASGKFTAVAAGKEHTCALQENGTALCWGNNWSGQVGTGMIETIPSPTAVDGGVRFRRISAGESHTCGISAAGKVLCWGGNTAGQIGDGSKRQRPAPQEVTSRESFTQVVAGGEHSCALTSGGRAFCWGRGREGQIGDGARQDRTVPTAVQAAEAFTALAAGDLHSCGVTAGGAVFCWGANASGQLGSGGKQPVATPAAIRMP